MGKRGAIKVNADIQLFSRGIATISAGCTKAKVGIMIMRALEINGGEGEEYV